MIWGVYSSIYRVAKFSWTSSGIGYLQGYLIFKLGETTEEPQITAPSSDDDRFMSSDESEIESDEEERKKR